jgi:hypothetical protein
MNKILYFDINYILKNLFIIKIKFRLNYDQFNKFNKWIYRFICYNVNIHIYKANPPPTNFRSYTAVCIYMV